MEYIIINKVELKEGILKHTHLGYVESRSAVDILTGYCGCWLGWIEDNSIALGEGSKTLADLFTDHPICHDSGTTTDYLPEGLTLITSV
jgi:hypothetical protein